MYMLTIWLGRRTGKVLPFEAVDPYFNFNFSEDWFNDPLVKDMILSVDKTEVLSPYCLQSPVLGQIAPERLSGGVKGLIILLKTDLGIDATVCGENCASWLVKIGKIKDCLIELNYYMPLVPGPTGIYLENDKEILYTSNQVLSKQLKYIGGVPG